MSSSSLNTLPLDGLRPILSYLDLKSLIKLFATFDRKIQVLLSSPNAFAYLRIEALGPEMPRTPYRYFVSSIRNVTHLRLGDEIKWSPYSISFLQTLNPRHLTIGADILHESVQLMLRYAKNSSSNEVLRRLAQHFDPYGIPNFPLLTPRLETLEFAKRAFAVEAMQGLSVPPTLIKLEAPADLPLKRLLQLPLISLI